MHIHFPLQIPPAPGRALRSHLHLSRLLGNKFYIDGFVLGVKYGVPWPFLNGFLLQKRASIAIDMPRIPGPRPGSSRFASLALPHASPP